MFIQFSVSNYRSIGEEQILSLIPAPKQRDFLENILEDGKNRSLNAVAIYGANGSGKSNVLSAMRIFKRIIHSSARTSSTSFLAYDPFLLREDWSQKPTKFEIIFSLEGERYRYGFEYNSMDILSEWLFRKAVGREVNVFERENDIIEPSSGFRGSVKLINAAIDATRNNALFLSTCDMFNIEEANLIFKWLSKYLHIDGDRTDFFRTERMMEDPEFQSEVSDYINYLKLGPVGIEVSKEEYDAGTSRNRSRYNIKAKHHFYDKLGKRTEEKVGWDYMEKESNGSKKALQMSGPIINALQKGGILIVDEIESKMHPLITLDTINLFLNKETNPENAQIIFATHDTNLLTYSHLRRDQIYFAEKNSWESTEIYSLSDFVYIDEDENKIEKERTDTDKEKRYFEGRYGAIPVFGQLSTLKLSANGK